MQDKVDLGIRDVWIERRELTPWKRVAQVEAMA
jgi:hypothetical protein